MKKFAPFLILFVLALLILNALFGAADFSFNISDGDFDGPTGGAAALLFAGGGILIGFVALVAAAVVLAFVFAGVGIVLVLALALAAVAAVLAISPLLLPLLIPIGIVCYLANRNRHRKDDKTQSA